VHNKLKNKVYFLLLILNFIFILSPFYIIRVDSAYTYTLTYSLQSEYASNWYGKINVTLTPAYVGVGVRITTGWGVNVDNSTLGDGTCSFNIKFPKKDTPTNTIVTFTSPQQVFVDASVDISSRLYYGIRCELTYNSTQYLALTGDPEPDYDMGINIVSKSTESDIPMSAVLYQASGVDTTYIGYISIDDYTKVLKIKANNNVQKDYLITIIPTYSNFVSISSIANIHLSSPKMLVKAVFGTQVIYFGQTVFVPKGSTRIDIYLENTKGLPLTGASLSRFTYSLGTSEVNITPIYIVSGDHYYVNFNIIYDRYAFSVYPSCFGYGTEIPNTLTINTSSSSNWFSYFYNPLVIGLIIIFIAICIILYGRRKKQNYI